MRGLKDNADRVDKNQGILRLEWVTQSYGDCWYKPRYKSIKIAKSGRGRGQNLSDCSLMVFILTVGERKGFFKGFENKEVSEQLSSGYWK